VKVVIIYCTHFIDSSECFPVNYFQWMLSSKCFPVNSIQWMLSIECFPLNAFHWMLSSECFPVNVFHWMSFCRYLSLTEMDAYDVILYHNLHIIQIFQSSCLYFLVFIVALLLEITQSCVQCSDLTKPYSFNHIPPLICLNAPRDFDQIYGLRYMWALDANLCLQIFLFYFFYFRF